MPPFNYNGHLYRELSELGLRGGVAVTIELNPTAIDHRGKKLHIHFAKLNGSSLCKLLYLIWPQPMHLELPRNLINLLS